MDAGYREEVLNVTLARVLASRRLVAVPESLRRSPSGRRMMPDVIVTFRGLRLILEGKVADRSGAEAAVFEDIQKKVDEGIGHIGLAVVYPENLRHVAFDRLEREFETARLRFRVYSENGSKDWSEGTIDLLSSVLAQVHEELAREDVVTWAVGLLNEGIEQAAEAFASIPSGAARALEALEFNNLEETEEVDEAEVSADDDEE